MPSLQSALAEHETASYADSVLSDQSTTRVGIPDANAVPSDDRAPDDHKSRASVGYDLSRFDQRETVRDARLSEARNVPKRKRKTAARAKFSALTLMLCVVTALLSVALIFSYVELTVTSDKLDDLNNIYTDLKNTGVLLKTQYESRYDLTVIEEYAQSKLGMVKLERSQIEYVEIASPDTITRVSPEKTSRFGYILSSFAKSFNAVLTFIAG